MMDAEFASWFTVLAVVFTIVLVIAWILLPFAMFGVKSRLLLLIHETKRTNSLLEEVREQLKQQQK